VILGRPSDVVEVAGKEPGGYFFDPFHMVHEPEIVLDLDVPEVVPITYRGRIELSQ
jgi:hypothetical protein